MQSFKNELSDEFPEWHAPVWGKFKNEKVWGASAPRTIRVRQPRYVLPMILTMLLLGVYCIVLHIQSRDNCWKNEQAVGHVEKNLVDLEQDVSETRKAVRLVAIVINEDFSAIRKATGNQHLLFIEKDWGLSKLPTHIQLSDEEKQDIIQKYIKNRVFTEPELDDDGS